MNRTELYIKKLYKNINIYHPYQLTINGIIQHLNLSVIYWKFASEITFYDNTYKVFINENLSVQQQWQDFGHEMYHYCHDHFVYDRLHESYADYGESKADYFAYHFCVPTFMLQKMKRIDVYDVMQLFNVEFDFALRRLEMYQNKILEWRNGNGKLQKTRRHMAIYH